ncbi:DNA polymerase III subunit gamma/tau [Alkalimonas amylolytica]|uniref:DNA polymerase III subunit gamma/tau n=1 Tax=Alkalimonas amylolytica TaxID=152573 RepID=A0A1H4F956_ALKAM|nr:DNA polymerase III subunit gamma/tau [Alkalimonas amylolytica]SEA93427.1 DNA polymerase-3 subunit gamma/tau [Alkalimonas amylolytica]
MSYQVLARKWRPQQFSQLLGQQHVKSALSNALSSDRLHHAYLFTGTRGVGKTTIARIFAKSLNCELGVTATPCGQCSSCLEIEAGRFVDLLEIDAASRTKVEDTRDLLDNVQYAPTRGRFKVYLIDEVHMLSRHSFNALLKTLEEPPPHVKFLLATTDPQKLPVTVLSRCLQFSLKALTEAELLQQLSRVLQQEQVAAEQEALVLLAKAARGSVRDALSLTDQAIAQTNGHITATAVRDMLGLLPQHWGQRLLQAVLQQDVAEMRQQLDALMLQTSQPSQLIDDMLALLHFAAICQFQPDAAELAGEQAVFVAELAASQEAESLQLYYQLLISGKRELPYAPDIRSGLEMALLRALLFVPQSADASSSAPSGSSGQKRPRAQALKPPLLAQPAAEAASSPLAHTVSPSLAATQPEMEFQQTLETAPAVESMPEAQPELTKESEQPELPELQTQPESPQMDPITASIIARRGVQPLAAGHSAAATVAQSKAARPAVPAARTEPDVADKLSVPAAASQNQQMAASTPPASELVTKESAAKKSERPRAQQLLGQPLDAAGFHYRAAHEIDDWAALIEQVNATGLYRLFLLHSVPSVVGSCVQLIVAHSEQHLETDEFRHRIEQLVLTAFPAATEVQIVYQPEVTGCPRDIQQQLDQARRSYVQRIMAEDPVLLTIRQNLTAEFIDDSLVVN